MTNSDLFKAARILAAPKKYTSLELSWAVDVQHDAEERLVTRKSYTKKLRGVPDKAKKVHI